MTQAYLSDHVSVAPRYQRSIRIDADFGQADPLSGYVLQGSARDALTTINARMPRAAELTTGKTDVPGVAAATEQISVREAHV